MIENINLKGKNNPAKNCFKISRFPPLVKFRINIKIFNSNWNKNLRYFASFWFQVFSKFNFLSLIWIYKLLFIWVNQNTSHCFSLNYSYRSLSINATPWSEHKDFCFSLNYSYRSLSINTTPWAEHKDFCFRI